MERILNESEYNRITSKRIIKLLGQTGLTQMELADALDVSGCTVNYMLNQGKVPKTYILYRLAKLLDCQFSYLCEGSLECDEGFEELLLEVIKKNLDKGIITPTMAGTMKGMIEETRNEIKKKRGCSN